MRRIFDVNGKSGTGDVWEGVEFDNKSVAGRWMHEISSNIHYPSVDELINIHGHEGKTIVEDSEYGELFELVSRENNNNILAQGFICSNGVVVLLFVNNNGICFFDSISYMQYVYGTKYMINKIEHIAA
jgi:hypothetical protein